MGFLMSIFVNLFLLSRWFLVGGFVRFYFDFFSLSLNMIFIRIFVLLIVVFF